MGNAGVCVWAIRRWVASFVSIICLSFYRLSFPFLPSFRSFVLSFLSLPFSLPPFLPSRPFSPSFLPSLIGCVHHVLRSPTTTTFFDLPSMRPRFAGRPPNPPAGQFIIFAVLWGELCVSLNLDLLGEIGGLYEDRSLDINYR